MSKIIQTKQYFPSNEPITVMAKDGLEYFEAVVVDRLHVPNLNKISHADQILYLNEMKNRSYESEIEIKWISRRDNVYKNIHQIQLQKCEEKRSSRSRGNRVGKKKGNLREVLRESKVRVRKLCEGYVVPSSQLPLQQKYRL